MSARKMAAEEVNFSNMQMTIINSCVTHASEKIIIIRNLLKETNQENLVLNAQNAKV